jgi:uncharacterized membrane protein
MGFFLVIFAWTVCWTGYNIIASKVPPRHLHAFDPHRAFAAYLLISSLIQIPLMPLLMVGQNLQGRHSEARAEADFLVNQKALADSGAIIKRLENPDEKILGLALDQPRASPEAGRHCARVGSAAGHRHGCGGGL